MQNFIYQKEDSKRWLDLTEYWNNGCRTVVVEVIDNRKQKSEVTMIDLADEKQRRPR